MTPWTAPHQALPSMGFPRQEYWSGLPCPPPGDPPLPGMEPVSCTGRWLLTAEPSGKLVPGCPSMQMWGLLQGTQLQVLMVWVPESLYQVLFTTCYSIYIIYVMQTNECVYLNLLDLIFGVWLISMGISSLSLNYVNSDQLSYLFSSLPL